MTASDPTERLGALADALAPDGPQRPPLEGHEKDARHVEAAARALDAVLACSVQDASALLADLPDDTIGPVDVPLSPDYEVVEELGRGGMGIVFRAHQRSLDREVAVKVLRPGDLLFGQSLRRFRKEAQTLAKLRHRHIVTIHEVGGDGDRLYYTMDYVRGPSLARLLADEPLTTARVVRILRQVASAVSYVHGHGVIHRDLKPANILIDENGDAIVTDFGLALELGSTGDLTLTGQVLGTPAYMSPEQARGQTDRIGESTDVYAMGAVLYECLTGKRPFAGLSAAEQVYAVIHREPTPPRKVDARIPVDLALICQKAMRKRQEGRYPTAQAFLDDLERFDEGKAVRAQAPSRMYRLGRFCRRHAKGLVAGTTAGAALLFLILGVLLPKSDQYRRELIKTTWQLVEEGAPERAIAVYDRMLDDAGDGAGLDLRVSALRAELAHLGDLVMNGSVEAARALGSRLEGRLASAPSALRRWDGPKELAWWLALLRYLEDDPADLHSVNLSFSSWRNAWSHCRSHGLWDTTERAEWLYTAGSHPGQRLFEHVQRGLDGGSERAWAVLSQWGRGLHLDFRATHYEASILQRVGLRHIEGLIRHVTAKRKGDRGLWWAAHGWRHHLRAQPLRQIGDRLAALLQSPGQSEPVRDATAFLLCDVADLPCLIRMDYARKDTAPLGPKAISAWRRVRNLSGLEALRARLRIAMETCRAGADEYPFASGLGHWVQRRLGGPLLRKHAELASFIEEHIAQPSARLEQLLGLHAGWEPRALVKRLGSLRGLRQHWAHHLLSATVSEADARPRPGLTTRSIEGELVRAWHAHFEIPTPTAYVRAIEVEAGPDGWPRVRPEGQTAMRIESGAQATFHWSIAAEPGDPSGEERPWSRVRFAFPGFANEEPWRAPRWSSESTWDVGLQPGARGVEFTARAVWRAGRNRGGAFEVPLESGVGLLNISHWFGGVRTLFHFRAQPDRLRLLVRSSTAPGAAPLDLDDLVRLLEQELQRLCALCDEVEEEYEARRDVVGEIEKVLEIARHVPFPQGDGVLLEVEQRVRKSEHDRRARLLVLLCRAISQNGGYQRLERLQAELNLLTEDAARAGLGSYASQAEFWVPVAAYGRSREIRAFAQTMTAFMHDASEDARALRRMMDMGIEFPPEVQARAAALDDRSLMRWLYEERLWPFLVFWASLLVPLLLALAVLFPLVPAAKRMSLAAWGPFWAAMALAFRVPLDQLTLVPSIVALCALAVFARTLDLRLPKARRSYAPVLFLISAALYGGTALGLASAVLAPIGALAAAVALLFMTRSAGLILEHPRPLDAFTLVFYGGGALLMAVLYLGDAIGWFEGPFFSSGWAVVLGFFVALAVLGMLTTIWTAAKSQAALLGLRAGGAAGAGASD